METTKTLSPAAQTLLTAMREKWTIVRLARARGQTIAETSRYLNRCKNPQFRDIFESLNWPLNVSSGHIYIGSFSTKMGPDMDKVREYRTQIKNLISRGQKFSKDTDKGKETRKKFYLYIKKVEKKILDLPHIVGGSVVHGERTNHLKPGMHVFAKPIAGKAYSEIFLAKQDKEYLIEFGFNNKITGKFEKKMELWLSKKDIAQEKYKEDTKTFTKFKNTGKTRIKYSQGHWMGVAPSINLISVNSNWK